MEPLSTVNEEEIKVKYILPWLGQIGVELNEIQLERSFSLKVGRQSIPVGQVQARKRDKVSCRLDILVQRSGRNLLIVETKADGLQLTDDDRDQAISYARLVHPMAPYAVVTNGREYELYDSITKSQVNLEEVNIRGFTAALPDDDIAEAQSLFLALNPANLIAFCRSQVAGELRIVKGMLTDGRKYVPELHTPRDAILKVIKEFYSSPLPGLLLTGQSGSGKTCEMCWLSESLLKNGKPVLFFNGISLEAGILDAIAAEFSWTFNGSDRPVQILRRMAKLAGSERLTIIVDAIDEWIYPSRGNHLGSLLCAAEDNNIKIILSCKTSAAEKFIFARGNPTKIGLLTKKIEADKFTEREFFSTVDKYRQAYQFFGIFEDTVLDEARSNPFLLRVIFDVAKDLKFKHLTFSSAKFFETYFNRSISHIADMRQAEDTLKAIAGLLYQDNIDWISEEIIRKSLDLRVTESIMEELFEYGILLRSKSETGTAAIGFYFQQLRDYIVAFKVLRFNMISQQQLASEFDTVTGLGSRADVFSLYYRLASMGHKIVLDREVRENAARYLHSYTSLVQQHFPELREIFNPQTDGRIGFIGEFFLVKSHLGGYGFRALGETDEEIHFIPVQQAIGKSNLSYLDGADQLHWASSAHGFRKGIDITSEVINNELLSQLSLFMEEGSLNESNCSGMLIEFIVETVLQNTGTFKELLDVDGRSIKYPLNLDEVLNVLLRVKLQRHYRHELTSAKRRSGEIEEMWDGGFVSYSSSLTAKEEKQISGAVDNSLDSGSLPTFHARYVDLDKLERSLMKAINWLHSTKAQIESPLYVGESKLKIDVAKAHPISNDDAKSYLVWLYSAFLENYKCIIETNFPTLKQHFRMYSKLPISVHLVLGSAERKGFGRNNTPLTLYFSESRSSISEVKVVDELKCNMGDDGSFSVGGVEFQAHSVCAKSFESLFSSITGRMNDPFQGMTLRRLVYEKIMEELNEVKQIFRAQCENQTTLRN